MRAAHMTVREEVGHVVDDFVVEKHQQLAGHNGAPLGNITYEPLQVTWLRDCHRDSS